MYRKRRGRKFSDLTLVTLTGAVINDASGGTLPIIFANDSSRVTIEGFTINDSAPTNSTAIFFRLCLNCAVVAATITSTRTGINASDNSRVFLDNSTIREVRTGVSLGGMALIVMTGTTVENTTFQPRAQGLHVEGNALARVLAPCTFRGFDVGIEAKKGGVINVFSTTNLAGGDVVLIENNNIGARATEAGHLRLNGRNRVAGNGTGDPQSGGIFIQDGSTLELVLRPEIEDNLGQGILVTRNSQARIWLQINIAGNQFNGVAAIYSSTIDFRAGGPTTVGTSGAKDVFCSADSFITGGGNFTAGNVDCPNIDSVTLPMTP